MITQEQAQGIANNLLNDRTKGLEIECFIDRTKLEQITNDLEELGHKVANLGYEDAKYQMRTDPFKYDFIITTDGSLERSQSIPSNYIGKEFVTKPLHSNEFFKHIDDLTTVLNAHESKVNSTCGLHMHIDAKDFNAKNLRNALNFYKRYEKTLDCLVSPSRRGRGARYCTTTENLPNTLVNGANTNTGANISFQGSNNGESIKYHKLNLRNYHSSGTIEFRHFNSTLDFSKIVGWCSLCDMITSKASKGQKVEAPNPYSRNTMQGLYNLFLTLKLIRRDKGEVVPFSTDAYIICKWLNDRVKDNGFYNIEYNVNEYETIVDGQTVDQDLIQVKTEALKALVKHINNSPLASPVLTSFLSDETIRLIAKGIEI
jgi:hypothetical protein